MPSPRQPYGTGPLSDSYPPSGPAGPPWWGAPMGSVLDHLFFLGAVSPNVNRAPPPAFALPQNWGRAYDTLGWLGAGRPYSPPNPPDPYYPYLGSITEDHPRGLQNWLPWLFPNSEPPPGFQFPPGSGRGRV